jgi:hypothetical protein
LTVALLSLNREDKTLLFPFLGGPVAVLVVISCAGLPNAFKAKARADMDSVRTMVAKRKQEFDANRAENTAERLEWEAGVAVDYAIACGEQAEVAVLDAIAGRSEAEAAKSH